MPWLRAALAVAIFAAPQHASARSAVSLVPPAQLTPAGTAQSPPAEPREADFHHVTDLAWFAGGALAGLLAHELGHVAMDLAFGKSISLVEVKLGPFPFVGIQPCCRLSHAEQFIIASAGFNVQAIDSELIYRLVPRVRQRRHAFLKGVLALDIGLSLGYALSGFAGVGPQQSDVNTMSRGIGLPPWQIGMALVVPALVDVYRYVVPDSRWAPWLSVQSKLMMLGGAFVF